jgi:Na+/melibiose symporter-like transporter
LELMPVTVVMFFLSSVFGSLAGKYGPRWFMAGGPLVIALAYLLMLRFDVHTDLWLDVLPAILLFGLGLSITVAPLTAAVLGAIDSKHAGIASAINNAVARVAGLLAVAAIGAVLAMQFSSQLQQGLAARNVSLPQTAAKELEGASLQVKPPSSVPVPMRPAVQEAQTDASVAAFRTSIMVMAGLTALGGVASAIGIRNNAKPTAVAGPRSRS